MTSPEKIKRLNIEIPLSLHRRVKTGCAREELAIADVVRELLDRRFPADPDAASRSPRRRGRAVDGAHGSTPRGTP